MSDIVDYIVENYIVFLIILFFIVMVIIGYIAEKTDFWRNKKSSNKNNDTVDNNSSMENDLEKLKNIKLGDVVSPNNDTTISEPTDLKEVPVMNIGANEDLNVPFGEPINLNQNNIPIQNVSASDSFNINEDLNVPFGDQAVNNLEEQNPKEPVTNDMLSASEFDTPFIGDLPSDDSNKEENNIVSEPNTDINNPVNLENSNLSEEIQTSDSNDLVQPVEEDKVMDDLFTNDELEPVIVPEEGMPNFDAISDIDEDSDIDSDINDDVETTEVETSSNYNVPVVPEFIVEDLAKDDSSVLDMNTTSYELDNLPQKEEDIWKF